MSDSDDFGGLGATTPNISRKLPRSNPAGPSRAGGAAGRKKAAAPSVIAISNTSDDDEAREVIRVKRRTGKRQRKEEQEMQEDDEAPDHAEGPGEGHEDDESEDVQEIEMPTTKKGKANTTTRTRGGSKKPAAGSTVNGKANAAAPPVAAKGKSKAKLTTKSPAKASSSRLKHQEPEEMDVDAIEVLDDDDEMDVEEPQAELARAINNATGWSKRANGKAPAKQRSDAEARLEEQLQRAQGHIEDLTRQLEELNQVRRTEAEQLLERMEAQFQAQLQAKDSLIQDITTQLNKEHPLLRTGNGAFEVLTREEANRETEVLQKQVRSYKEAVRERDQRLKVMEDEKDALKEAQNDLRIELQMEVDRANGLAAKAQQRQPPSTARPRAGGILPSSEDPKIAEVVKFYEDLTNLLIPSMKLQPGKYLGMDEWSLNCLYTHRDVVNRDEPTKSLNFTLRLCHDLRSGETEPVTNKEQLVESVHYTPHELGKESEEFREGLNFLKDAFTFERDQLSLFLRTLHDYVSGEGNNEDGNDSDVQVIG